MVRTGQIAFYEKFLEVDVRFPLHPFICSVLNFFKIAPRQLMPNSWRYLLVLLILSKIFDPLFPLDLAVFLYLYYLKDVGDVGQPSFYHRGKSGFLVTRVPSSKKSWKNKFFFVSENWAQSHSDELQHI